MDSPLFDLSILNRYLVVLIMSVISKQLFYEKVPKDITCDVLHYWHQSCFLANVLFMPKVFWGTLNFFLPVYIVKALIQYKKNKKENTVKNFILSEIRTGMYGAVMFCLLLGTLCSLRKIFGTVHYYNIGFLPGMMAGLSVLVESKENRVLDKIIYFNLVIEAIFNNVNYFGIFKLNRTNETLVFMFVSCFLMHLLANRKKKVDYLHLWFYSPKILNEQQNEHICDNIKNCSEYSLRGSIKYFGVGYLINIIRLLIPKMKLIPKKPYTILSILFNLNNVLFGTVIGGYVASFRYLTCILKRSKIVPEKYHAALSGLFSGVTYAISPNIQLLVIAITSLLQAIYHRIRDKFNIKSVSEIPSQILFMVCSGILVHNRIFCSDTCPSYFKNLLKQCTLNRCDQVYRKLMFLIF